MSNQSPFQDLLAGLQSKSLPVDPDDDVLFRGSLRDDVAPSRYPRGTQPPPNLFAMPAPPPAPLPSPHLVVALPHPGSDNATARVGRTGSWRSNKKMFAISIGLSIAVVGALAAYLTASPGNPTPIASAATIESRPVVDTKIEPAPAAAQAMPAAPSVMPIESAPAADPAGATAAAPDSAMPALPKDAVAPPTVVPASQFEVKSEPTLPMVAAGEKASTESDDDDAEPAKTPAKASKAKRAAKRETKRSRQRETKQVARAERAVKSEVSDSKLDGNGALSIASSQPREVWVDGRNSKRMTPLRVLLKPGKHKVTLFDKSNGKAKTFDIEIKPNVTTKVSK